MHASEPWTRVRIETPTYYVYQIVSSEGHVAGIAGCSVLDALLRVQPSLPDHMRLGDHKSVTAEEFKLCPVAHDIKASIMRVEPPRVATYLVSDNRP